MEKVQAEPGRLIHSVFWLIGGAERFLEWCAAHRPRRARLAVAAIATSVLAFLYAVGALLRAAELRHAGVSVRDALPLFPIEQLLARGVYAGVLTLALGSAFCGALILGFLIVRAIDRYVPRAEASPTVAKGATIVMGLVVLVGTILTPPLPWLASCAAGLLLGVSTGYGHLAEAVVASLALIGLAALLTAILQPQRLALIQIDTSTGQTMRGQFIVHADGVWHLAGSKNLIIGVPDRQVRAVHIKSYGLRRWSSLLELIEDAV